MTTLYHTTDAADAILRNGFRDATGSYLLIDYVLTGVFLADVPLDCNEGAKGSQLLAVTISDDVDLSDFELSEDGKPYREWCIPSSLLNSRASVQLLDEDAADAAWLRRHQ